MEQLLKDVILPDKLFSNEHCWSGIMGMESDESPIIEKRGMGVAIGTFVGQELAQLCLE